MLKPILDDCVELSEECTSLRNTLGDFEIDKQYIELCLETQEDCYAYMEKFGAIPSTEILKYRGHDWYIKKSKDKLSNISDKTIVLFIKLHEKMEALCDKYPEITNCSVSSTGYIFISFLSYDKDFIVQVTQEVEDILGDSTDYVKNDYKGHDICVFAR